MKIKTMSPEPQICPHCYEERFSTSSNFNRHVATCHKNPAVKFIKCSDCNRKFVRRDTYLRHIERHEQPAERGHVATVDEKLLENYDNGKIHTSTLFDVKVETQVDIKLLNAKECLFRVNLTKQAFKLAHAGRLYSIMKTLFDRIIDVTKVRQQNILVQLVIESKNLEYPICTGAHRGTELKFEQLIERFDAVSQSLKVFEYDEANPELTVTVFQMPVPTYGSSNLR